jgi:hypothetical protein
VDSAPGLATTLVRALDEAGMLVDNIEVRQPSLEDVFFALTGPAGSGAGAPARPGAGAGAGAGGASARGPARPGEAERQSEGARA